MPDVAILAVCRLLLGLLHTVASAIAVVVLLLGKKPDWVWLRIGRFWSSGAIAAVGIRVEVLDPERLRGPALFISNHQSFLDPILLPTVLPPSTKWVAKKEFAKVPLLGRAFSPCAIYVDRNNAAQAREAMSTSLQGLPEGWSVAIFPEGTRSPDGELKAFKNGAFFMALQSRLPIVPLGIAAQPNVLPHKLWATRPGRVTVAVGDPISTTAWQAETAKEHVAAMHAAVARCLQRARAHRAEAQ